jgi:putative long chain acyl-CoA synthase
MCRRLVDAPPVLGEKNNPVRLFAGSGMRKDVWRRMVDRFGTTVLELYASTEASVVLANASGKKLGSVGRPLPGSPEVAIAAYNFTDRELVRDGTGKLVRARLDEPGMLVARVSAARAGADVAHIDPKRLIRDAFEPGDTWFVTGDIMKVDTQGDYWFVDRQDQMILTKLGAVASTRVEDGLYEHGSVALCIAAGLRDPDDPTVEVPVAAVQLHPAASLDLIALSAAAVALPEYARPRRLRIVEHLPLTDGFRPIKRGLTDLAQVEGPNLFLWNARTQRYEPSSDARSSSKAG